MWVYLDSFSFVLNYDLALCGNLVFISYSRPFSATVTFLHRGLASGGDGG